MTEDKRAEAIRRWQGGGMLTPGSRTSEASSPLSGRPIPPGSARSDVAHSVFERRKLTPDIDEVIRQRKSELQKLKERNSEKALKIARGESTEALDREISDACAKHSVPSVLVPMAAPFVSDETIDEQTATCEFRDMWFRVGIAKIVVLA